MTKPTLLIGALLLAGTATAIKAESYEGSDINSAIPIVFGQTITDVLDIKGRPDLVYALDLARGQQITALAKTVPAAKKGFYLLLLAPDTPTVARWRSGFNVAQDNFNTYVTERTFNYTVPTAGRYYLWITTEDNGVGFELQVKAVGAAIDVPLPQTTGCVEGSVDAITYTTRESSSGLAEEILIAGTKICRACDVKPPLYPALVQKLERAQNAGLNASACYDATGQILRVSVKR